MFQSELFEFFTINNLSNLPVVSMKIIKFLYRSGTINSNTVNSNFHLIQFLNFLPDSYHFMFKMHG